MTIVVDASVVVSAFVGREYSMWAQRLIESEMIVAPHLMPAEAANVLRRLALLGDITQDAASMAYLELNSLRVTLFPFEGLEARIWALGRTLTIYDAWHVALAETLDVSLATLDRRLTRSLGPQCRFLTPEVDGDVGG